MTRPYSWTATTITDLVSKPEYMGHTVNFRTFKESYKDKHSQYANPEDWLIFRDTQEAIVDEDTWYVVQKIRETKHRPIAQGKANPLTGLMFCADCGGEFIKFIATVFKFLLLDYLTAEKECFHIGLLFTCHFFVFLILYPPVQQIA